MQTPYYLIHKDALDANFNKLVNALKGNWNNFIVAYSYKTNSLPWIIKHFDDLGCYAEVVSSDEYDLAKRIGVKESRIVYNGPIKTKESFLEAVENRCIVNIDSQREIDWLDDVHCSDIKIGIRVNFDIEAMCPGQFQCPDEGGRFGFCFENGELGKALSRIQEKGFAVSGLHLHTSSKSRGLDIYRAIAETACKVSELYNLKLDYIDVGGGFFGGLPSKPQFDEYMQLMAGILSRQFRPEDTALIVEPGMAVIGAFLSYVTSVIDVKNTSYNRFVVTDGTRTSIDPLMTKTAYSHAYELSETRGSISKQIICGSTCMEHDRLFVSENEPELCVGDRIIYDKVGAYTMCLTPLFIQYFPDVYVESNGALSLVRAAWHADEYIQKSIIESWSI